MSVESTPPHNKTCKICGTTFYHRVARASLCSEECKVIQRKRNQISFTKSQREKRPDSELVTCLECGERFSALSGHLKDIHGITCDEYREKYPGAPTVCDRLSELFSENFQGEKNPGFDHGGKFSPWSSKSEFHTTDQIAQSKKKARENYTPDKRETRAEYWINQGFTEQEAQEKVSERQRTFTLEKCIERHGETRGREVHADRQFRWNQSYKKSNYSKVSQELFWKIMEHLPDHDVNDIYFAQFDKGVKQEDPYVNLEYTVKLDTTSVKPDFFIASQKKVIEFDGTYWHSDVHGGAARSQARDEKLVDAGYQVLHIPENVYRETPHIAVNQCLDFIRNP